LYPHQAAWYRPQGTSALATGDPQDSGAVAVETSACRIIGFTSLAVASG
jgi:hypothetical protein